ncbi:MAG: GNAT family N-acetyltransferase [Halanaerobiales bacterium]|nr:GNAT family N-acetyltransferase [Halanaerobiales bacterium]
MREKKIARYFYSPLCPESFATLERLKNLFQSNKNFSFDFFNTADDKFPPDYPWFPEEKKVISTLKGKTGQPLFFGKLMIDGEAIKGFPPSPQSLQKVFNKHNLSWNPALYPFNYQAINRPKWLCKKEGFFLQSYKDNLSLDICRICTKHHPYLEEKSYRKKEWLRHEKQKFLFLQEKLKEDKLIGIIAYYQQKPVGFVEAFQLGISSKLGFPVSALNKNGLMITCLSVRTEVKGYGLATHLLQRLVTEAKKDNYQTLEVISFPDKHNWQPASLYKRRGFKEIKKLDQFTLLKKSLL